MASTQSPQELSFVERATAPYGLSRASLLGALAAGAAGLAVGRTEAAQEEPLRVAGVFSDLFGEPFYEKGAGAFAKAGFAPETSNLANAAAIAAALGGGSLEIGLGDPISGVNAMLAGVPIVMIAGGGLYRERTDSASTILAVAMNSPYKTASDLIGKTIGVPTLSGLTAACLQSWLPANGVPLNQVRIVEVTQSSRLPGLARGTIDATILTEPFITFGKGQIRSVGSPYNVAAEHAVNKEFVVSVWFAAKPWFEENPERARRAISAIYATANWANAHRDETFDILVRYGDLDAAKARGMQRCTYATTLNVDLLKPMIDIGVANKMFIKPVQIDSLITRV